MRSGVDRHRLFVTGQMTTARFAVPAFAMVNVILAGAWLGIVTLLNREMRVKAKTL